MGILKLIGGLLEPVTKLVDVVYDSPTEKAEARAKLMMIQGEILKEVSNFESILVEAQSKIIIAEAQSQSWLTRNWRPLLMLDFIIIIFWNHFVAEVFGVTPATIPDHMWSVIKIGVGGYIGGRTFEKVAPKVIQILKK